MPKQNILFGRLGNKTNDIKHFKHLLPLDIKTIVEPFGGTFAVTRIVYNDKKFKKYVNDNDETLFKIYSDPKKYSKMCKTLNSLASECKNENGNVQYEEFIEEASKLDIDSNMFDYWKIEKIIKGRLIKIIKKINHTDFIDIMDDITFSCDDYKKVINKFRKNKDTFIFLDPPYLFSDNSSYSQQKRKEGYDMTDMIYEILEIFKDKTTKAKIMLIINDMKIIRYLFKDFAIEEYEKIYQLGKRKCNHLIITNYELD